MQVSKVAVVATGALATAAAIGSTPAFAADSQGAPEVAPATVGVLDYEGKHRASDEAMQKLAEYWLTAAPNQTWSAPWEQEPAQVLSLGSGSALSLVPVQQCATSGPLGLGASAPISSPSTVLGDCRNGSVHAGGGGSDSVLSVLDGTAVSALPLQQCGTGGGVLGLAAPVASPATQGGSCSNGNVSADMAGGEADGPGYTYQVEVTEGADASAPVAETASADPEQAMVAAEDAAQVLSAGGGTAASVLPWQQCASTGWALGAAAPISSPLTVLDGCRNGNIAVHGEPGDGVFSALDASALSVAPFQQCGSGGGVGTAALPVASPLTVAGGCANGNVNIR
jgi:hypothetical protein